MLQFCLSLLLPVGASADCTVPGCAGSLRQISLLQVTSKHSTASGLELSDQASSQELAQEHGASLAKWQAEHKAAVEKHETLKDMSKSLLQVQPEDSGSNPNSSIEYHDNASSRYQHVIDENATKCQECAIAEKTLILALQEAQSSHALAQTQAQRWASATDAHEVAEQAFNRALAAHTAGTGRLCPTMLTYRSSQEEYDAGINLMHELLSHAQMALQAEAWTAANKTLMDVARSEYDTAAAAALAADEVVDSKRVMEQNDCAGYEPVDSGSAPQPSGLLIYEHKAAVLYCPLSVIDPGDSSACVSITAVDAEVSGMSVQYVPTTMQVDCFILSISGKPLQKCAPDGSGCTNLFDELPKPFEDRGRGVGLAIEVDQATGQPLAYITGEYHTWIVWRCPVGASSCERVGSGLYYHNAVNVDYADDGSVSYLVTEGKKIERCSSGSCRAIYNYAWQTTIRSIVVEYFPEKAYVFVIEREHCVKRCGEDFSSCTVVAGTCGQAGSDLSKLSRPCAVALEPAADGTTAAYVVADRYNGRVVRCPASGASCSVLHTSRGGTRPALVALVMG